MKGYFITGTDTGCGKTEVTLGLMNVLQARGYRVLGMKPVATGAEPTPRGLRNADARLIQQQASSPMEYSLINPYTFEPPIAPHLAADRLAIQIDPYEICRCSRVLAAAADYLVVEGVGGWCVPLGPDSTTADLAVDLGLPVILVVGLRLGCINHALLSTESILASGVELAGWVANRIDPGMLEPEANITALQQRIPAPLLGVVPHLKQPTAADVAASLRLEDLSET